jgi:hypothetical protein
VWRNLAIWIVAAFVGYWAGYGWMRLMHAIDDRRGRLPCRRHRAAGGEAQPVNGFRCQRCKRYITWREISE